jgi:hypothetical protein
MTVCSIGAGCKRRAASAWALRLRVADDAASPAKFSVTASRKLVAAAADGVERRHHVL